MHSTFQNSTVTLEDFVAVQEDRVQDATNQLMQKNQEV